LTFTIVELCVPWLGLIAPPDSRKSDLARFERHDLALAPFDDGKQMLAPQV
jgi:hypothetical protein